MEEFKIEFDSVYENYLRKMTWISDSSDMDCILREQEQERLIVRCNEIYRKYYKLGVTSAAMEEYMHQKGLF